MDMNTSRLFILRKRFEVFKNLAGVTPDNRFLDQYIFLVKIEIWNLNSCNLANPTGTIELHESKISVEFRQSREKLECGFYWNLLVIRLFWHVFNEGHVLVASSNRCCQVF